MMNFYRLCLLAIASFAIVGIYWQKYHLCTYPVHTWIMVYYAAFFPVYFIQHALRDIGRQQRYNRFYGGIIVRSSQLLFPFLWAWTITGTVWYIRARNCLPDEDAKWRFLVWLLTCYSGLACLYILMVLDDLVREADWAFEAARRGWRGIGQDAAAYQPGFYVTPAQRVAAEALIRELPKFLLKVVLTDCRECPICLDEFRVENEVRGLPCAHNFHAECIDKWLRLNVKCPVCRCCVFPKYRPKYIIKHPYGFWEAIF